MYCHLTRAVIFVSLISFSSSSKSNDAELLCTETIDVTEFIKNENKNHTILDSLIKYDLKLEYFDGYIITGAGGFELTHTIILDKSKFSKSYYNLIKEKDFIDPGKECSDSSYYITTDAFIDNNKINLTNEFSYMKWDYNGLILGCNNIINVYGDVKTNIDITLSESKKDEVDGILGKVTYRNIELSRSENIDPNINYYVDSGPIKFTNISFILLSSLIGKIPTLTIFNNVKYFSRIEDIDDHYLTRIIRSFEYKIPYTLIDFGEVFKNFYSGVKELDGEKVYMHFKTQKSDLKTLNMSKDNILLHIHTSCDGKGCPYLPTRKTCTEKRKDSEYFSIIVRLLKSTSNYILKGDFENYIVNKGDTLWSISENFYGSGYLYHLIISENRNALSNEHYLVENQLLKIPTPAYYINNYYYVLPGESVESIAKKHNVPVSKIKFKENIENISKIYPYQVYYIYSISKESVIK